MQVEFAVLQPLAELALAHVFRAFDFATKVEIHEAANFE
jgi:hypothetical protein